MISINNLIEKVEEVLQSYPLLKTVVKKLYLWFNFLVFKERNFKQFVHPDIRLYTPYELLGVEDKYNDKALFFGYYDKSPWSSDMRKLLFHKLNNNNEFVELLIFDIENREIKKIAESSSWNFQQGCMAQWLPNSENNRIIFNDIYNHNLISRIIDIGNKSEVIIPCPIQTIHPSGEIALTLNYKRLAKLRPDYGYKPYVKNFSEKQSPDEDGVWLVDLLNKTIELRLSLLQLMEIQPKIEMRNAKHKVNHIFFSPDGSKFIFLHRWFNKSGKYSRLYVANSDFSNLQILLDNRMISHYSWENANNIIVFGRNEGKGNHYYKINVINGKTEIIAKDILDEYGDGHPSFSPDKEWILTDTYPDKARQRHLLLFHIKTEKIIELGRFFSPLFYEGIKRCDLHPRWSPDGKMISIDSSHDGRRFTYILDVSEILNNNT